MDLARFVAMVSSSKLPLVRLDLLADEFEGSIPSAKVKAWMALSPANAAKMAHSRHDMRREAYVSSWTANDAESDAMWRVYCGVKDGIAIESTYARLDQSLSKWVQMGMVNYADFDCSDSPCRMPT
jgi:hypothetical protein